MNERKILHDLERCAATYVVIWNLLGILAWATGFILPSFLQWGHLTADSLTGFPILLMMTLPFSVVLSAIHCLALWRRRSPVIFYSAGAKALAISCVSTLVLVILLVVIVPGMFYLAYVSWLSLLCMSGLTGWLVNRRWAKPL